MSFRWTDGLCDQGCKAAVGQKNLRPRRRFEAPALGRRVSPRINWPAIGHLEAPVWLYELDKGRQISEIADLLFIGIQLKGIGTYRPGR